MYYQFYVIINHLLPLRYDLRIDPFEVVNSAVPPNVNVVHPFTDATR